MRRGQLHHRPREEGIALLTAILVVALATTVVTAMVARQQLEVRRSANLMEADQVGLYANGLVSWAGKILSRDLRDNNVDHARERWATVLPPIAVENGQLAGRLEDVQGRFNLNSLLADEEPNPLALARFQRLLRLLDLDEDMAITLLDWLDADINRGYPAGAEDDFYLGREPPYRAANGPMVSPSELLLVNGVDREAYEKLGPHVTVLPVSTAINVNTATVPVLMSLADGISEQDAEKLVEDRGEDGYASVGAFLANKALAGREITGDDLSVTSDYFLAVGDIRIGRLQRRYFTLLHRQQGGGVRTVSQSIGVL
jgi:general secretion pathway protein K